MFNDNYYPAFSAPVFQSDYHYNNTRCSRPSRAIDKEMYERLLKSFDPNDSEDDELPECRLC